MQISQVFTSEVQPNDFLKFKLQVHNDNFLNGFFAGKQAIVKP